MPVHIFPNVSISIGPRTLLGDGFCLLLKLLGFVLRWSVLPETIQPLLIPWKIRDVQLLWSVELIKYWLYLGNNTCFFLAVTDIWQHNITGRVWTIQELQLLWRWELTVGELLRLFCLVQCNVLHPHTFAVWYNLCLCMVYVYTNCLLAVLVLLVKQHQWESVSKVLLSFG